MAFGVAASRPVLRLSSTPALSLAGGPAVQVGRRDAGEYLGEPPRVAGLSQVELAAPGDPREGRRPPAARAVGLAEARGREDHDDVVPVAGRLALEPHLAEADPRPARVDE